MTGFGGLAGADEVLAAQLAEREALVSRMLAVEQDSGFAPSATAVRSFDVRFATQVGRIYDVEMSEQLAADEGFV